MPTGGLLQQVHQRVFFSLSLLSLQHPTHSTSTSNNSTVDKTVIKSSRTASFLFCRETAWKLLPPSIQPKKKGKSLILFFANSHPHSTHAERTAAMSSSLCRSFAPSRFLHAKVNSRCQQSSSTKAAPRSKVSSASAIAIGGKKKPSASLVVTRAKKKGSGDDDYGDDTYGNDYDSSSGDDMFGDLYDAPSTKGGVGGYPVGGCTSRIQLPL
jgi:hypothetical protein